MYVVYLSFAQYYHTIGPSVFRGFGFILTARGVACMMNGARFPCFNFFLGPDLKSEGPIKGLT